MIISHPIGLDISQEIQIQVISQQVIAFQFGAPQLCLPPEPGYPHGLGTVEDKITVTSFYNRLEKDVPAPLDGLKVTNNFEGCNVIVMSLELC